MGDARPTYPAVPKGAGADFQGSVVIIGAGASGLMAALSLERMGVTNYTVLEASGRYGGRLRATPDAFTEAVGTPLEIGAEWLHDPDGRGLIKEMMNFGDPGQPEQQGTAADQSTGQTAGMGASLLGQAAAGGQPTPEAADIFPPSAFVAYSPDFCFHGK